MIVLILVASSLYVAYVFSYLYLWTVSPKVWAPGGSPALPALTWPLSVAALLAVGTLAMVAARKFLPASGDRNAWAPLPLAFGGLCLIAAVAFDLFSHWSSGLGPNTNAYGAMVYMALVLNAQLCVAVVILIGFAIARYLAGKLDRARRVSFDNAALLYYYTAAQSAAGLILIHGFPRAVA
jgi:cytochrome c oxidase subunit I+III